MSQESQRANPATFSSAISPTTATPTGTSSLSSSSPLHRPRCGHSQEGLKQLGAARFLDDDQCCRIKLRDHGTGNLITCGALFSEHPRWDHPTPQIQPTNSTPSISHPSIHPSGSGSVAASSIPSSQLKNLPPSDHDSGPSHDHDPVSTEQREQANRPIDEVAKDDQSVQNVLGVVSSTSAAVRLAMEETKEDLSIDESLAIVPAERHILPTHTRAISPPPLSEVGTISEFMAGDLGVDVEYFFSINVESQDSEHLQVSDFFRFVCQGQPRETDWVKSYRKGVVINDHVFRFPAPNVVDADQVTLSVTHIRFRHPSSTLQLEIKEVLERLVITFLNDPDHRFHSERMNVVVPIDEKPGALVRLQFEIHA